MPTPRQPLVLVPGLLLDERLFSAQSEGLADLADVRVERMSGSSSMQDLAAGILARAPERFALAGLSMGGYAALEIMAQAPERVSRLALLDTQARADDEGVSGRRRTQMGLASSGNFDAVLDALLPGWVHAAHLADQGLMTLLRDMAASIGAEGFLAEMQAIMGRRDRRDLLPTIACPTLVLCGREDQTTPLPLSEEMAAAIPMSTLVVLSPCGHLSPLERPAAVTGALRLWLEGAFD